MLLTFNYITIIYLAMGCQKTCGGRFLYIKIFLATLYTCIIKCLLAFDKHVHLPCNSQYTLPLDNKVTSNFYCAIITCIVFLHILMIDILIRCSLIAE